MLLQQGHIIITSISQAFQEFRANKLRTFLSLLGVTIGIFCIIAVFTVVDSLKNNINESMAYLGNDVLYINKQPWIPEEAEYKWWEYLKRPPMTETELRAINKNVSGLQYATLCYTDVLSVVKHGGQEANSVVSYAVTDHFDKLQTVDIQEGRYMTASELAAGSYVCVIGEELKNSLFVHEGSAVGSYISFNGRKFEVIGTLKKTGQNVTGFNFDNAIVYAYQTAKSFKNLKAIDWGTDPLIMAKSNNSENLSDFKDEVEGALRIARRNSPGAKKDFAINQLSTAMAAVDAIFGTINLIGFVIAGFSLVVGGFGIANIMFVTVKERTKVIGLKKAIGAKSTSILMEFLVEAITLCVVGGIIGILIVLITGFVISKTLDFPITLSINNFIIGISISILVGVLAGFIPARTASRLNAVVAMRSN